MYMYMYMYSTQQCAILIQYKTWLSHNYIQHVYILTDALL